MATVEVRQVPGDERTLADPWPWMWMGVGASAAAFCWTRLSGDGGSAVRFLLIAVGLVGATTAVCLRFWVGRPLVEGVPADRQARTTLALALAGVLLALGSTALLVVKILGDDWLPWATGEVVVFWLLTAPWSAFLASSSLRQLKEGAADERTAGAGLLMLAGLTAFLTCWALYLGAEQAGEWDSLRLLLAIATLVAFVASAVAAAGPRLRRVLLSVLIVLHLGGISTAVLAYPPSPWLMQVLRSRVYGPYLEFMQLGNAYRFYSPEPWPATQLWFRVEYRDAANDQIVWNWFKIPDVDEQGRPRDAMRLKYQRRLSLTENITPSLPMPPREYRDKAGLIRTAEYFRKRDRQCPEPTARENQKDMLGREKAKSNVFVPYLWQVVPAGDPRLRYTEYAAPDINSRLLLDSYARYAARLPHPKYPNAAATSVKIYKVLHRTLTPPEIAAGADPQDLTNFLPYYEGQYDPQGYLQDPDDPFLYWMLPIVRVNPNDPNSPIEAWVYLHSGDKEHYRALRGR